MNLKRFFILASPFGGKILWNMIIWNIGGIVGLSSVLKSRAYNRIPSNFDTLDLWRLWKSSVVVLVVQDGV